MTDEEMAEFRATKFADINFNEPDNYGSAKEIGYHSYYAGFLAGFEEGRPKWHDLRKNPKDLPNENEIVLCYCLGYCGVSFPITARLYIDYNDANVKRWWTIAGEGKSEQLNNVIAWKEIVQPEANYDERA